MKMCRNKSYYMSRGFTLVELSIVLVIIGLIIGGVLTGQQIIQNARVTNAINAIQAYEAQFQTYTQNYGALPGDDNGAKTRFPNALLPGVGDGNGSLNPAAAFDSTTVTDETALAWADLRAAGLVKNQVPTTNPPPNPFNGVYGYQNGAFSGTYTTTVLCLSNVPGSAAQAIDTRLDDGTRNAGSIQANGSATTAIDGATYDASQTYVMCIRM